MSGDEEEEVEEDDMETEDRDDEETEKPNITFDPSLPTSHAVSVDTCAAWYSRSLWLVVLHTTLLVL